MSETLPNLKYVRLSEKMRVFDTQFNYSALQHIYYFEKYK